MNPSCRRWWNCSSPSCWIKELKLIGLAMQNYMSAHNTFPLVASPRSKVEPLLSWRVHLLPYLDEGSLYNQFHLDEPWDSPHNRALIDKMPSVYRSPGWKPEDKGLTRYLVPVGKETLFPPGGQGMKMNDITGSSHTIVVVEADHAVTWTKPEDLRYNPNKPAAGLPQAEEFRALYADGHVDFLCKPKDEELRSALGPRR
jgi:hypothetical protein